ncbi:MAG: hypothetical protein ACUZ77_01040 [Candidatus Brocadiales bacterium]
MSIAVKGVYKDGKIKLLEELKGIEEADVIVVVTKKRKKEKKKDLTSEVRKALKEVKLMREGKLPEREWHQVRDEI